ncbi:Cytosolic fatty-acid binding domain and Calycin-like domain and Calycin domain-containing protein [Strongyloides ratti]|uniref:Cytosolic fatty-acid binding domain and Calycin-like domain and Calycin domain-containing protein n=1 Tax=Strongyloides ratti TaxID=34506 RepID=A0A090L841_STRRB|nr:Cytosolic fatty-acid binding domain and Calycin-like domain and Calycin domain-containing protein [Strongyloides ratti]CEF64268.1 Cytosolic fatty-acid binding domain and Calycin-like domain and Calycin domain-containing protein [Strongyloides ratti]
MKLFLITSIFIIFIITVFGNEIPKAFLGTFKLDRSENLDNYLIAKDIGFLQRKIVAFLSVSKEFSKNSDGTYNFHTLTTKKNLYYDNVTLNKEFEGRILDGSKRLLKFTYNPITEELEEHQIDKDNKLPTEIIYYTIKNGILVWKSTFNGVTCKRYYNKVQL